MPGDTKFHLPFFCPKDIENSIFFGVANKKYIYKCKTCKRAFTDTEAVAVNTNSDNNNNNNNNREDEYAYEAHEGQGGLPTSALLQKENNNDKKLKRRTIVHRAQENLKGAAVKLEKARYVSVMKKVDRYGGGLDSPQFRPKTVMGGIISFVFIGAMLAIIILNLIKLAQGARSIVNQGTIQINHYPQSFKGMGIIPINGSQMDFPVMNLHVQNNIIFFNADKPPVQKIKLIDNSHFNPSWDTHNDNPPTTRSIYTTVEVPYDCISDPLFKGDHSSRDIDVDTVWKSTLPSFFSQSLQSLQLLEMETSYENKQFFPHEANLFIRFNEDDMSKVLPYQLDVSLVNDGEVSYFKGPDSLNKDWMNNLQTLSKAPQTWNFSYNMQKEGNGFNLLEMKSSLSSLSQFSDFSGSSTNPFLNWRFVLFFTSNFNYTNPDKWYCLDDSTGITNISNIKWDNINIWAEAPNATANSIQLYSNYSYNGPLPADIYMWNLQRIEKASLVSVDGNTWTIQRPHPVNFVEFSEESDCLNTKLPIINSTPPPTWSCPDDWYLDAWCDCGCGDVDPMCAMCQQKPDNCLTYGMDTNDGYCTFDTQECSENANDDFNGPFVSVGFPCARMLVPGDDYLRGWYGSTEQYRQATSKKPIDQCPWDWMYNGEPNMQDDGTIICNATAKGLLFLDYGISYFSKIPVPPFPDGEFVSLLSSGAQSTQFSGTVSPNYTATFPGIPTQSKMCMMLDEQFVSMGLLISPLKFAQRQVFVIPATSDRVVKESNFFPPSGPYVVSDVSGYLGDLQITDASCPDEGRYLEQGLVLGYSPSSMQVSWTNGTIAYLTSPAYQTTTLNIHSTLNSFGLQLACCGSPVFAVIGDNEVIKITSVQWNGKSATCNSGAFNGGNETLYLERPLKGFYQIGASVEANAANTGLEEDCTNEALAFPLVSIVTGMTTIRDPGTGQYLPQERAKTSPPVDMQVEVAMFIVPQRKNFSSFLQLCNATGITPPALDPEGWQVREDRMAQVTGCGLNNPPDTEQLCSLIDCTSLNRMPPTTGVKFEHILPLNERWIRPTSQSALLNTPEYYMDVSVVYYFDYTQMDLAVAKSFSQNAMHDGDVNQYGKKKKFNGELEFIGRANTTDDEKALYPAPAPIFFMDTVLYADEEKTNSLIDSFYMGYRKFMGWNEDTVKKFYNISLQWQGIGPLDLQPGWNYTFTASITLQPVYKVGQLEGATLDYWINSTSTSFSKIQTDPNNNQAVCRLILTVNKDASVLVNRTSVTFFEFLASVGSAVALLSIGMSLLSVWQGVTGVYPDEEGEKEDREEREETNQIQNDSNEIPLRSAL